MNKFSLTITGIIVSVAGTFLVQVGFSETCSSEIVSNIPLVVGGIMAWIGRFRVGDISPLGVKK